MSDTITLVASATKFIADENGDDAEFDSQILELPSAIFRQAINLAEVINRDFKMPCGTHIFGADCELLGQGLMTWFETQEHIEPPRRQSGMTPLHQLTSYFRTPANLSWLKKLLKFTSQSRGFLIQE